MRTHEVPADQWKSFLDRFSLLHLGDHIDLESVGGGAGPRSALCDEPLRRIAAIAAPDLHIDVEAGSDAASVRFTIRDPEHLSVTELDDGYPVALQIASESGAITSVRLEPHNHGATAPPESFLG